jgi:hypothetical protein
MVPRAHSATFDADTVRQRLRELAFLNAGATIHFRALSAAGAAPAAAAAPARGASGAAPAAKRSASANGVARGAPAVPAAPAAPEQAGGAGWEELACPGGLRDYVAFLNRDRQPLHAPIYLSQQARRGASDRAPRRPAGPLAPLADGACAMRKQPCGPGGYTQCNSAQALDQGMPRSVRHSAAQQDCLPCPRPRALSGLSAAAARAGCCRCAPEAAAAAGLRT